MKPRHDRARENASRRVRLAYLREYGEYVAEGRPRVEEQDVDKLLFMLRIVHGEPRFDYYPGSKNYCAPIASP